MDSIEVVRGQYGSNFEKCKVLDKADMSFSIYTEELVLLSQIISLYSFSFDLIAETPTVRDKWVDSLEILLDMTRNPLNEGLAFIDAAWQTMQKSEITFEETRKLLFDL